MTRAQVDLHMHGTHARNVRASVSEIAQLRLSEKQVHLLGSWSVIGHDKLLQMCQRFGLPTSSDDDDMMASLLIKFTC